ncbi:Malate dehydrogenase 2 [Carabus blaptoides fortunei]
MFKNIVLYDWDDITEVFSDLQYVTSSTKLIGYSGWQNLDDAIQDATIVYICDGVQTVPGMSDKSLIDKYSQNVRQAVMYCSELNPKAMLVIASNPVPCFVPMAIEEYKKSNVAGEKKIFGLARTYVSKANSIIGRHFNIDPSKVNCHVVGGIHRNTCIPVLSQIQQGTNIKRAENENLTRRIQEVEEDYLHDKMRVRNKKGCYLLAAYAGADFITSLGKAYNGDRNIVECAFVKQESPIDKYARYLTSLVKIGEEGIISCHLPKLSELEKSRLNLAKEDIIDSICTGENFVTGETRITAKHRPKIEKPKKIQTCQWSKPSSTDPCKQIEAPKTMKVPV